MSRARTYLHIPRDPSEGHALYETDAEFHAKVDLASERSGLSVDSLLRGEGRLTYRFYKHEVSA